MNLKISVFFLLLCIAIQSLPPCKQVYYDHYALALTWPKEFCSEKSCKVGWSGSWNGRSLTIHGLWPSSSDLSYLSCFQDYGIDPYCNRDFNFRQSYFTSSELADLNKYWPQYGSMANFWSYEWQKHGTCFLKIFKQDYASPQTDKQLLKKYFATTIQKTKKLNITLQSGTTYKTKTQFAKKIGLKQKTFNAICGRDNELDEIRICYDIYHTIGQEDVIQCPGSSDSSICRFPIVVK